MPTHNIGQCPLQFDEYFLTFFSSFSKSPKNRMNGVDVVLVIVYKDNDTYSKLHWDKPMSKPETTATTATRDKY